MEGAEITARLEELERDLASRQNRYEAAAGKWHGIAREREYQHAVQFIASSGDSVTERKQHAAEHTALIGAGEEAEYEGLKAAIRVMEIRSMILMGLLKSLGRA